MGINDSIRGKSGDMPGVGVITRDPTVALIEVRLSTIDQLFNSLDPSPFHEKDLDKDAEDYIVGTARELPARVSYKLVVHLPDKERRSSRAGDIATSIHNYFAYRRTHALRELRLELRRGRTSLLIGLAFLATCLTVRQLLVASGGTLPSILAEGLLIAGWVAMWRPIEIFLYDWWPIRQAAQMYGKLANAPVDVVWSAAGQSHASEPAKGG